MTIVVKNEHTLLFKDFQFRCCVGKNKFSKKKTEGDKKTPIGIFNIGSLYYRADRFKEPLTKLKTYKIKKTHFYRDSDSCSGEELYNNHKSTQIQKWQNPALRLKS